MRQLVQTTTLTRRVTSTRLKGTCLQYTTPAIPITETAARPSHIGRPRLAIVSIKHFSAASVGSGFLASSASASELSCLVCGI